MPKTRLFRLLRVSHSGYYDWLRSKPPTRLVLNTALDAHIQWVYAEHAGRYGYRRICNELRDMGLCVSLERVRRRMKRLDLRGIQKRKFKHTTDSKHSLATVPNLLNQCFQADVPNTKWVGDITYIRVKQQWLYLAVVIDRGSQYCSGEYQKLIRAYGLRCSMSRKGNCYDNAVCESFFHSLKVEQVYHMSFELIEQARREIFWFIEAYYNLKRKHSTLGYKSPVNFEIAALQNAA